MAPKRPIRVQRKSRTIVKKRSSRPRRRQVLGPISHHIVRSCTTQYVVASEHTNYGWLFGHDHLVDTGDVRSVLKSNGITDFDDLRLNWVDVDYKVFLKPETHLTTKSTYKCSIAYPSDSNYHPVKGEIAVPAVGSTTETQNDYLVGGFILRDAEYVSDFKFSSVDHMLSHPTMLTRIVAEPSIITFKKRWYPTEPSERDWSSATSSPFFKAYLLCTNMDSTGWVSPTNFRASYKRTYVIMEHMTYSVSTRGKTTSVSTVQRNSEIIRRKAKKYNAKTAT